MSETEGGWAGATLDHEMNGETLLGYTIRYMKAIGQHKEDILFIGFTDRLRCCSWVEFEKIADFKVGVEMTGLTIVFNDQTSMKMRGFIQRPIGLLRQRWVLQLATHLTINTDNAAKLTTLLAPNRMKNFLTKTLRKLKKLNLIVEDVAFVVNTEKHTKCTWSQFAKIADLNYCNHFPVLGDLVIVFKNGGYIRFHDGLKRQKWKYTKPLNIPATTTLMITIKD